MAEENCPANNGMIDRISEHLAMLLGDGVADWEREDLAEKLAVLSPEVRALALKHLPVVWPVSYALYYSVVDQAAKAASCLHSTQFSAWVSAALDVYEADGLRQAQLFLESVEDNFLCQIRGEAGVRLDEVENRLLPYARSLLERDIALAPAPQASFDTSTVFLPAEVDTFPSQANNFLFYKFTITFLVALDRMGTFRARDDSQKLDERHPVAAFLGGFANLPMARDLFYLAEAIRIVARLHHDFSGLMADVSELRPVLSRITPHISEISDQSGLIMALRRWLMERIIGLPLGDLVLPEAIAVAIVEHYALGRKPGASMALTRVLYGFAETLAGPYLPGPPLAFMGELAVAAAYEGIDRRQEERQEKIIDALSRMIADQQPSAAKEEQDEIEPEPSGPGRNPVDEDQGAMMIGKPGSDVETEDLEEQLASGVLRVGGMEFELSAELEALLREMVAEGGRIPVEWIVSAVGRAGSGLEPGVKVEDEDDGQALAAGPMVYDEWDYRRAGFRKQWCQVRVKEIVPVAGTFVATTLSKYRGLLVSLRRQFEMMSVSEAIVRRQRDGDEINLDALIEAVTDLRAGVSPSERLYNRLQRNDRQIATLFLLDMSSSTEGWVSTALKESLILMCEALSALGDRYAIYGFSGMRRLRSEIFTVKEFDEVYDSTIKGRIAAITPKEYTRMGPAIRHASQLLAKTEAKVRLLITLSDGKPEDYDGYKGIYAIEDTRHALIEAKMAGIHPFCITVDKEAHAYMAHMYGEVNYIFIDQVAKLPRRMPEIYRNLTT